MCDASAAVFQLVKTAVVQVLVSRETQGERAAWSYLGCGAMCLIEDESVCSYFLRLYCVKVRGTAGLIIDPSPACIYNADTSLPSVTLQFILICLHVVSCTHRAVCNFYIYLHVPYLDECARTFPCVTTVLAVHNPFRPSLLVFFLKYSAQSYCGHKSSTSRSSIQQFEHFSTLSLQM